MTDPRISKCLILVFQSIISLTEIQSCRNVQAGAFRYVKPSQVKLLCPDCATHLGQRHINSTTHLIGALTG